MRLLTLTFLAISCATATVVKAADGFPPGLTCPERTVVIFRSGPNPDQAASLFHAHLAFTISQLRAGTLLSAGPFSGAEGGVMIFRDKDWNAVQRILVDEPFTKGGVFVIDRHRVWNACELAR
jgi:uncharacterized protein YciI